MDYEVGKEYEFTKKNGRVVKRKCVGIVDKKYIAERSKIMAEHGFAPMFVTPDGYVFLSLSPASRKRLSDEERARRQKIKEERRAKRIARIKANAERRIKELQAKLAKYA